MKHPPRRGRVYTLAIKFQRIYGKRMEPRIGEGGKIEDFSRTRNVAKLMSKLPFF